MRSATSPRGCAAARGCSGCSDGGGRMAVTGPPGRPPRPGARPAARPRRGAPRVQGWQAAYSGEPLQPQRLGLVGLPGTLLAVLELLLGRLAIVHGPAAAEVGALQATLVVLFGGRPGRGHRRSR